MFVAGSRGCRVGRLFKLAVACVAMPVTASFGTEKLPDYEQQTIQQSIAMVGVDGGSYGDGRSQQPEAFTVAARTNPERYWEERDDVYHLPQDNCSRELEGKVAYSIGFRIARPLMIPSRKLQLWHWGIYFDHDKWEHLTLEPTASPAVDAIPKAP